VVECGGRGHTKVAGDRFERGALVGRLASTDGPQCFDLSSAETLEELHISSREELVFERGPNY
jgi:hypothetical protein